MFQKKRSEFASLADVGRIASRRAVARDALARLRIFNAWGRAVGEGLRTVTRPVRFDRGTLHVEILDGRWLAELRRLEPEILARFREALPSDNVRAIRYGP